MTEAQLRQSVVNTITGWLGFNEADGSHRKIIDIYNNHKPLAQGYKVKYTDAWCATTVSAVSIQCGLTDIMPTECSCIRMVELYKLLGRWQERDSYVPNIGDIVMYDWQDTGSGDDTGSPDHVGIVTKVSGNYFWVTEGNYKDSVKTRQMQINGKYIRGFCLPDYAKKAGSASASPAPTTTVTGGVCKVEISVLKNGSTGKSVKALQILLNGYGHNCGTADGDFGTKTLAAVKAFQKDNGLVVDGSVGSSTWSKLLGK